jgi:hypothetical protein
MRLVERNKRKKVAEEAEMERRAARNRQEEMM